MLDFAISILKVVKKSKQYFKKKAAMEIFAKFCDTFHNAIALKEIMCYNLDNMRFSKKDGNCK